MELRHLRYFVTAAEFEHFGKAAAKLGIVQPALSKQIRELEEELGVSLFERLPRGVRLSAAGQSLLQDSQALLAQAAASVERARDAARGNTGILRLGFVDTTVYHPLVPRIIQAFRSRYPGLRLELHQDPSLAQWEGLRAGRLDAGLVYHLPPERSDLKAFALGKEEIQLVVPRHHPLATRDSVSLKELREEAFVFCPRSVSPPFHDKLLDACRKHHFEPRIIQEAHTDHAIISLVAAGAGLTFCIASARSSKPRDVEFLRVRDLGLVFQLSLIWSAKNHSPALANFLHTARGEHAAHRA